MLTNINQFQFLSKHVMRINTSKALLKSTITEETNDLPNLINKTAKFHLHVSKIAPG